MQKGGPGLDQWCSTELRQLAKIPILSREIATRIQLWISLQKTPGILKQIKLVYLPKVSKTQMGTISVNGLRLITVFSRERLRRVLRKKAAVILHLHTFTSADLDLHTFTPADLDLHTLTSADLDLHIPTPADLDLHTLTSADLHHHTLTPCRSRSSHLHICRSTSSHPHTCRSRSSHPHTCRSRSSHLHICRSPLALLLFSLNAGAVPPERHETQPFRTKWTLDVKNLGKIAILKRPRQPFRTKWTLDVKN